NDRVQPAVNPAPFTVSVNAPTGKDDGLTEVMPGSGMTVTEALPEDPGDAVLAALTVTLGGDGGPSGAKYLPVASICPTLVLPPAIPFTLHVTPADAPVTVALNV